MINHRYKLGDNILFDNIPGTVAKLNGDGTYNLELFSNTKGLIRANNVFEKGIKLQTTTTPNPAVTHPTHYTGHPSGVECIQITEHMNFNLGNVIKYVWRADLKENALQDLEKAVFYLQREIEKRKSRGRKDDF